MTSSTQGVNSGIGFCSPQLPSSPPQNAIDTTYAIAGGLLSSSCCAIQLLLNMAASLNIIHVGCVGFNKTLGPLRPLLRSITLLIMGKLWFNNLTTPDPSNISRVESNSKHKHDHDTGVSKLPPRPPPSSPCCATKSRMRLFFQSCLCLFLMFLPEALLALSALRTPSHHTLITSTPIIHILFSSLSHTLTTSKSIIHKLFTYKHAHHCRNRF